MSSNATEVLERLWRAGDTHEVRTIVGRLSSDETRALVDAIDLADVPLNAFHTEAFERNGLDDRMVVVVSVARSLLEEGSASLGPLLDKLAAKSDEKIRRGASAGGPAFESSDPWRIGESLMLQMHDLAIELLKPGNHDGAAAALLEAVVLDYPDRLESRFWLAAARHNVYLERLDAESKTRALGVIDGFLEAARGHPDYRSNVEAIEGLRRSKY